MFKETSTIGFRYQQVDRKVMQRRFEQIDTELDPLR
ncbi:MAG: nickel insertion protein [Streptococcus parasanguinis]